MKALSVRQPWANLIMYGGKDIENRRWKTGYRGPLLIHASKTKENWNEHWRAAYQDVTGQPYPEQFDLGGIIGMVDLVDCVQESKSRWFEGPWGFVLENPRPIPFMAWKGQLNLFEVDLKLV